MDGQSELPATASFTVVEHPTVPAMAVLFAAAPIGLIALGALVAGFAPLPMRVIATRLSIIWAASILAFLAGVRRGLSFRSPDGPALAEIATMLALFALAFIALISPDALASLGLLVVGYAAIGIIDPISARKQEAPLFFARLRPIQMGVAVVSLLALAASTFW